MTMRFQIGEFSRSCSSIGEENSKKDEAQAIHDVCRPARLLKFSLEFGPKLIYNGTTLVGFLSVEYKEDYSAVQGIDEQACRGNSTSIELSDLVPLQNFVSKTTVNLR